MLHPLPHARMGVNNFEIYINLQVVKLQQESAQTEMSFHKAAVKKYSSNPNKTILRSEKRET